MTIFTLEAIFTSRGNFALVLYCIKNAYRSWVWEALVVAHWLSEVWFNSAYHMLHRFFCTFAVAPACSDTSDWTMQCHFINAYCPRSIRYLYQISGLLFLQKHYLEGFRVALWNMFLQISNRYKQHARFVHQSELHWFGDEIWKILVWFLSVCPTALVTF